MNEDRDPTPRHDDIGCSRQVFTVQPEAISGLEQQAANLKLRLRVLRANAGHHLASLLGRYDVHGAGRHHSCTMVRGRLHGTASRCIWKIMGTECVVFSLAEATSAFPESLILAAVPYFEELAPIFLDIDLHESLNGTGLDDQIPFGEKEQIGRLGPFEQGSPVAT